jgi:Bacterial lipocalin
MQQAILNLNIKIIMSAENNKLNINTVREFNLERYLGTWYEIARFDHRFEKNLKNVKANYSIKDNGMIKVVNTGFNSEQNRNSKIIGKAKTTKTTGLLKVSFFWFFYSDYRVLALGDNYDWALVGAGKSDKYLWILSRTEVLTKETLSVILSEAEQRGYNTKRLIYNQKS